MKASGPVIILSLVLLGLVMPAAGADPSAMIAALPADTTGPPPENVSYYISQAKNAVAEQNWTFALFISTRGAAWYPENADLLCLQGYAYRKMGEFRKSVEIVSRAIPLDPKAVRYANRGYGYLALKNYSAALADAETGIWLDTNYTTNYGVKALALQGMGRPTEALAAIETALVQSPDSAHYWHVKGRVLAASGDCTGASAALKKSLDLEPGYILPYPGFGSARENLAALNTTCTPASALPTTAKSSPGWTAVFAAAGAVTAFGMKR